MGMSACDGTTKRMRLTEPDDPDYVPDHYDEGRIGEEYDNAWLYDVD